MMLYAATEAEAQGVRIQPQIGPSAVRLIAALDGYPPFVARPS
jgi:hypothetical protein